MVVGKGIELISCNSGKYYGELILKELNDYLKKNNDKEIELTPIKEIIFANGEIKTEILKSIRGKDIYIFQDVTNTSNGLSLNDNLMALKTLIDAVRLSDAVRINIIIPVFPYARQDKALSREAISARMIARELSYIGVKNVITVDIHNPAISGFFNNNCNLINLTPLKPLSEHIKENLKYDNLVISSPDVGAMKKAEELAQKLDLPVVSLYKKRDYVNANCINSTDLMGDVKDKDVFLVDDMLDTAGTMVKSVCLLKEKGAKNIYIGCSLPLLNGPAVERLSKIHKESKLKKVIGTNVTYKPEEIKKLDWYEEVSIEKYIARIIFNLHNSITISKYLS